MTQILIVHQTIMANKVISFPGSEPSWN